MLQTTVPKNADNPYRLTLTCNWHLVTCVQTNKIQTSTRVQNIKKTLSHTSDFFHINISDKAL